MPRMTKAQKAENDLTECRDIAKGYMTPRNKAINVFAQRGKVDNGDPDYMDGLVAELDRELALAESEHGSLLAANGIVQGSQEAGVGSENERVAELSAMIVELSRVRSFVIETMGAVNKSAG